jgi:hypothetical protein
MSNNSISKLGAVLFLVLSASAADASTYDLASQFSSTQGGPWTYGYIANGTPTEASIDGCIIQN